MTSTKVGFVVALGAGVGGGRCPSSGRTRGRISGGCGASTWRTRGGSASTGIRRTKKFKYFLEARRTNGAPFSVETLSPRDHPGEFLSRLGIVVQCHADGAPVVAVVLPDDLLAVQLPEPGVVIGARGDQVGRVCAERAVPDPALVTGEGRLEGVRLGRLVILVNGRDVLDFPDLGRVICATGRKLLDVGGEEDARDVLLVGGKLGYWQELGAVEGLDELPNENVALTESQHPRRSRSAARDVRHYWQRRAGSHRWRR